LSRRTGWQRALDAGQLSSIQAVLDEAGCDLYSVRDPSPRVSIAEDPAARPEKVAT
jgi:hypothetical protein